MESYWFTWFPGALLATFGIIALIYKGLVVFVRFQQALPKLLAAADELHPNGGGSVKDHVTKLSAWSETHTQEDNDFREETRARFDTMDEAIKEATRAKRTRRATSGSEG